MRPRPRCHLVAVVAVAWTAAALAPLAQTAGQTTALDALVARPLPDHAGSGSVEHRVATTSAAAQRAYDIGLAALHASEWVVAATAFSAASRSDRALAPAHSGLAVAWIRLGHPARAHTALAAARATATAAPPHDRQHVAADAALVDALDAPQDPTRVAARRRVLAVATDSLPDDVELWLQRGLAESDDPAETGDGSTTSAIPHFERAHARAADHPAARLYLALALANTGAADAAVTHARAAVASADASPRAHHALGHVLRRQARLADAIAAFATADARYRTALASTRVPPELVPDYAHNLEQLAFAHWTAGQMKSAEAHFKAAFDLPATTAAALFAKRAWPQFLRARGRFSDAFEAARTMKASPHPLAQATAGIEAGFALLAAGRFADAAVESNAALKLLRSGVDGGAHAAPPLLALQGEISLRTAQRERGREVLVDVANRLRARPGTDHWVHAFFAIEAMARAARSVGDWELAGQLAQLLVTHDPDSAWAHYAVGLVAERADDTAAATDAFTRAQGLWSSADTSLPELADIRKKRR